MQDRAKIESAIEAFGAACALLPESPDRSAQASRIVKARDDLLAQIDQEFSTVKGSANLLRYICHSAAKDAGWWLVPVYGEPYTGRKEDIRSYPPAIVKWWVGTKIALMHSELSEGLEGLRKDKMDDHLPHLKSIDVEMADAIIRIMDLCGGLGIDIGRAIAEKLAYNAKREDHKQENRYAVGGRAF